MQPNRARVFLPQEPLRRNDQGEWEPAHDLTPALQYGDLITLMRHGPVMLDPAPVIEMLIRKMEGFSDADHVLGIGDPAAIAAAVMVASYHNFGRVKLLRWDRRTKSYLSLQLDVNERSTP